MQNNSLLLRILLVGISFGTAWAARGQFGHVPGAAMAGIVGGSALLLASGRTGWFNKMLPVIAASAIGWGSTGIISYGMVVGYCRASDMLNATYGYLSLLVIGGLFGLIGGGLVGLVLDSVPGKRVKWPSLLAEMTAGGIVSYYFLVDEAELLMTPPRSEAWAICLGAGLAMVWHMVRNGHRSALRVASYAMLGAGFGFSFGNFLQTAGAVLQVHFNMWNVMEYNIGFWGGSAMAYGVLTSAWQPDDEKPATYENRLSLLLVTIIIPLLVWKDAFLVKDLVKSSFLQGREYLATNISAASFVLLLVMVLVVWLQLGKKISFGYSDLMTFYLALFLTYILWSYLVSGFAVGVPRYEQPLYLLNLAAFLLLIRNLRSSGDTDMALHPAPKDRWLLLALAIPVTMIILSFVSQSITGNLPGANLRFP